MNIKMRIILAGILGILVGTCFRIINIIQKYSSRQTEEAIGMGLLSAIGFFVGNSIDAMYCDRRKKWLIKAVLIWGVLMTCIVVLLLLLNIDNWKWYTLTILTCFSIPLVFSNFQI